MQLCTISGERRRIFHAWLANCRALLTAASGPRRPNAARALCKESYIDEPTSAETRAPQLFLWSLPKTARLVARQDRHALAWPLPSVCARKGASAGGDRAD